MKDSIVSSILNSLVFDLQEISRTSKEEHTISKIQSTINTISDIKVFLDDKENINNVKRLIYTRMISLRASDHKKSKMIYDIYQKLREGIIDAETALQEFSSLF